MRERKKRYVLLLVIFVLSAAGFFLIHESTIKPYQMSGNGNFGILFMMPTVPIYLIFLFQFGRIMTNVALKSKILLILAVIVFSILLFLEMALVENLVAELGGGPENPASRIYRFGWFNQYTNTLFFNWVTFCMGMCISTFISSCVNIAEKRD
ncbi:hypothetical protein [Bacillus sp. FJAT-29814]|uniref:hypothetical protein n=1 Tax=Bacillus sp. FJAT-29814 TaxID=1729688 RepID=UPI0008359761|nr:hypothetical protein [Bacillus sp. FJAT-29814]